MVKLSTSDQLLVTWSERNWLLLITSEKLATSNLLLFDNRSQLPVNIYIKYYRCLKLYEVFNIINTMTIVLDKMQGVIRYRSQQSQILKTFDNIITKMYEGNNHNEYVLLRLWLFLKRSQNADNSQIFSLWQSQQFIFFWKPIFMNFEIIIIKRMLEKVIIVNDVFYNYHDYAVYFSRSLKIQVILRCGLW